MSEQLTPENIGSLRLDFHAFRRPRKLRGRNLSKADPNSTSSFGEFSTDAGRFRLLTSFGNEVGLAGPHCALTGFAFAQERRVPRCIAPSSRQRPSGPPDIIPDGICRGANIAFDTSPTASTLSSIPWKHTIRQGQASSPSYRHGKAPMTARLFNINSMSPPTFSA